MAQAAIEEVDDILDLILFADLGWLRPWFCFPLKFKEATMELAYQESRLAGSAKFFKSTLVTVLVAVLFTNASHGKEFSLLGRSDSPAPVVSITVGIAGVVMTTAVLALQCLHPRGLTDKRRLIFLFVVMCSYSISSRSAAVIYFGDGFEDVHGTQEILTPEKPAQIWSVMVAMIIMSICYNPACSQCRLAWFVCPANLIAFLGFNVPLVALGETNSVHFGTMFVILAFQGAVGFSGQASAEIAERHAFALMHALNKLVIQERVLRYGAERELENGHSEASGTRLRSADEASALQSAVSCVTDLSSLVHEALHSGAIPEKQEQLLHVVADLMEAQHLLIHPEELMLDFDHVLGMGGFAFVVAGSWKSAPVAVKIPHFNHGHGKSLALEIRHWSKLKHPHITSFLGACVIPEQRELLIVQELCDGTTLPDIFKQLGSLARDCQELRQHFLLDISSGLHYLHEQRPAIAHGDLKPSNVLVDSCTLTAKLSDFGLARRAGKDNLGGGTSKWLPVEIRKATSPVVVSTSVDIWALGGIGFFLSTCLGPHKSFTITGSSAVRDFGATVHRLWLGLVIENSIQNGMYPAPSKTNVEKHIQEPADLQALTAFCTRCMHLDEGQRHSARGAHEEVQNWRVRGDQKMLFSGQHSARCHAVLEDLRSKCKAQLDKKVPLSPTELPDKERVELLHSMFERIGSCLHEQQLHLLPDGGLRKHIVNWILRMSSWQTDRAKTPMLHCSL